MTIVTIRNDFHGTECRLHVEDKGVLTPSQVRRCRRVLCGIPTCLCGGILGERGKQDVEMKPLPNGFVLLDKRGDANDSL